MTSRTTPSIYTLNNHGDNTQPCLNPTLTRNHSLTFIPTRTHAHYHIETLHCFQQFSSQLNTLLASATCRADRSYIELPKYIFPICYIFFSHLPYSKHLVTCLNPPLLLPCCHSVPALTLFINTTVHLTNYTQQTNASRVTSFTLFPPFLLCWGTIHTPCLSLGTTPITKLAFNSHTIHSNTAIPPFFKHSTGNPSALEPYLISFTASLTSSIDTARSFNSPITGICQSPLTFIFTSLTSSTFSTCLIIIAILYF